MGDEPSRIAPGTMLGTYWIERQLGRGGMGAVFLAYDKRLRRNVALKILDENAGGAGVAERLLSEARSAAALNHPHICAIHEVAEVEGTAFIAMEYVSGRSLRARVDEGPLPTAIVVRCGIQAADALAYAHERGVVHRDFKAANVIVDEDGRLTIIDFGIAVRSDALMADATALSPAAVPHAAAGTPYAMAPEQVRGKTADARTDIWALGVLLYEMAAGRAPFAGETTPDLYVAVLTQAPGPLPASVPPALRSVIERCLQKDLDRRYQRAAEVRVALAALENEQRATTGAAVRSIERRHPLRRLELPAAALGIVVLLGILNVGGLRDRVLVFSADTSIRLAVLPFDNLAGDPAEEYFSDGLTDDMITQLGRLQPRRLSVIARASTMQYKGRSASIADIGRDLDADYVLQGTARRDGTRVRINTALIRVTDQSQRWAESFDRELTDILTVQREVSRGVADALAVTLLPAEEARLARVGRVDPEAYENQLKGLYFADRQTQPDLDLAQRHFERAIELDPDYAPPHVGVALVWLFRSQMGYVPPSEAAPQAKIASAEGVRLDPESAVAHFARAAVAWSEWDWAAVEREALLSLELNPNDARVATLYSNVLAAQKRTGEAIRYAERARRIDPLSTFNQANYGMILYFGRRYAEARVELEAAVRAAPELPFAQCGLWYVNAQTDRLEEALAAAAACLGLYGPSVAEALRGTGFSRADYGAAMRRAATNLADRTGGDYVLPVDVALAHLHADDPDGALEWFGRSVAGRDPNAYGFATDPKVIDLLGDDSRFADLVTEMQLPL